MTQVLLVSSSPGRSPVDVLPVLGLLSYEARLSPMGPDALIAATRVDVVIVDGRRDLTAARTMCRLFASAQMDVVILLTVSEGGFAVLSGEWRISDCVLETASPAEWDARIRLLTAEITSAAIISSGSIVINEAAYSVLLDDEPLDLTYTEFELLKYLVQHPKHVFSRETLLAEVWGHDYFGGTRTVDVHIRRLRAKLGPEHESLIGTVRNVGYRFQPDASSRHLADTLSDH